MAKWRANNGMGSIRQRPDGRWEARYTGPDGRQRSVYAKTEADVTKKLRGQLHEIDTGAWHEPSKMTVGDWLEIWMAEYQSHAAQQTRRTYGIVIREHIAPVIGDVRLSQLSQIHVQRVLNRMRDKGLSAQYLNYCRNLMSGALRRAVSVGLIRQNPAAEVKAPRPERKPLTIVDREQIPAFMAAAREHRLGPAMMFLLLTGLRVGEQRGLKWTDIDLAAGTVSVQRQLLTPGEPHFAPPKDGSVRTFYVPKDVRAVLKIQRRQQAEERLAAGPAWMTGPLLDDLVFRTAKGGYISGPLMYAAVRAVGQQIGLPDLCPHDLRHSYAVAALRSGVDVNTVQHNLGHKSAKMTLDVYATYTTDAGIVGAEKLSEYLDFKGKKRPFRVKTRVKGTKEAQKTAQL